MPHRSRSDIIRDFFEAFRRNDETFAKRALAEDFTFTSPYDDRIDKAEYLRRCWPTSMLVKENVIERIAEDGNSAFVTYKATMQDGTEFRNTEYMTFDGDRLKSVDVYFGASYRGGTFVPLPKPAD